jgi:4-alpha-glucanotransferase
MTKQKQRAPVLDQRRAGVLLHPTSLPGSGANGVLGPQAYYFIDFLETCGISVWQVLPLGPTHEDGSPYMGLSSLAGDPQLISLRLLIDWGWLDEKPEDGNKDKHTRLAQARAGFLKHASNSESDEYLQFKQKHNEWLDDFALFQAIRKQQNGLSWVDWPAPLRDRQPGALADAKVRLAQDIEQASFEQYVFFKQWSAVKQYANERGILLFGDVPIFVAHDSAEVWANREYFELKKDGHARVIAGVPPDYFSKTGQRWGNPLYAWKRMKEDNFKWWMERVHGSLELCDLLRVDHFRGFEAYWEIDAAEETAVNGKWVKAPGKALFNTLLKSYDHLPLVAEDLGTITPEVEALRDKYGLPGMKILQFAFDDNPDNPYLPHNHKDNSVVYTGTHDNNTTMGWFDSLADKQRREIYDYLGNTTEAMPWALIRCAMASTAKLAVVPMQDFLSLGESHRMNTPGVNNGNWQWRFDWSDVNDDIAPRIRHLVHLYAREYQPE